MMSELRYLNYCRSFREAYCLYSSRHIILRINHANTRGFTLLEIMVALVIMAIALSAASFVISRNAQNATYIDQKTAAHWVAMNVISYQQLKAQQPDFNGIADNSGEMQMLNHTWYWKSDIETVAVDHTYRINVAVSATDNGLVIDHLEGYLYHVISSDE